MATPQLLNDIVRLLIQVAPAMALVALVLAGIALRWEGGSTFAMAAASRNGFLGNCPRSVPQLLLWFNFFGIPVQAVAGGVGTNWIAGIRDDVTSFINDFVIGRLAITLAAYFVIRAILDATQGATRCRRF